MAAESNVNTREERGGTFLCESCGLREAYHYYGRRPPFHRGVTFQEDCYLMRDPFQSQPKGSFLLLGSACVACGRVVCQGASCSLFYTARFCLTCAEVNVAEFPAEVQQRLAKARAQKS